MDGIHDLGGRHGFGEVIVEVDEPTFHERWEAVVFALNLAAGQAGAVPNVDRFRHAIERIDPVSYLADTYYGRWLGGIETLLVEAGILDQGRISARAVSLGAPVDVRIAARPKAVPDPVGDRASAPGNYRELETSSAYAVGDEVMTVITDSAGHTRLPAYARGKPGVIAGYHGGWVFPDSNAHGQGEQPQHLYSVGFRATDLYGDGADGRVTVHLDLFEPYLKRRA